MKLKSNLCVLAVLPLVLSISACSGSGGGNTPKPETSSQAHSTSTVQTTLDPCQVVTAEEASALAGVTFGPGIEEDTSADGQYGRRCTYGARTANVFFVQVGQAASAESAKSQWEEEQAEVNANISDSLGSDISSHLVKQDLTGIADLAAATTFSFPTEDVTINGTSLAALKGKTFLAFGDLLKDAPAPTIELMQAQAVVSLARLP